MYQCSLFDCTSSFQNPEAGNKDYISKVNKIFGDDWKDFPTYGPGTFPNISEDGASLSAAPGGERNNSNSLWQGMMPWTTGKPRLGASPVPVHADTTSNNPTRSAASAGDTPGSPVHSPEGGLSPAPQVKANLSSVNGCLLNDDQPLDLCTPILPEKAPLATLRYAGNSLEQARLQRNGQSDKAFGKQHSTQSVTSASYFSKPLCESEAERYYVIPKSVHSDAYGHSTIARAGYEDSTRLGCTDRPPCQGVSKHISSSKSCTPSIPSCNDLTQRSTIDASPVSCEPERQICAASTEISSCCHSDDNAHLQRNASQRCSPQGKAIPVSAEQMKICSGSVVDTRIAVISVECGQGVSWDLERAAPGDNRSGEQSDAKDNGTVLETDFNRTNAVHILRDQEEVDVDEYSSLLHYSAAD